MGAAAEVQRVTDRATFDALRRGRRARVGAVSVTYLPAPADRPVPRAAFQVGRRTGGAVVRNRIRRRLRAGLRELRQRGALPPGAYLVGGRRELAEQPWSDLCRDLEVAVAQATRSTGGPT